MYPDVSYIHTLSFSRNVVSSCSYSYRLAPVFVPMHPSFSHTIPLPFPYLFLTMLRGRLVTDPWVCNVK